MTRFKGIKTNLLILSYLFPFYSIHMTRFKGIKTLKDKIFKASVNSIHMTRFKGIKTLYTIMKPEPLLLIQYI